MKLGYLLALAIGAAIGTGCTMALHVNQPGPDSGDWLGFVGALVGVSLTILGAVWLEEYRAGKAEREGLSIYRASLTEIREALEDTARERGAEQIAIFRADQILREQALIRAFEKFVHARLYVPSGNIAARQAAEEFEIKLAAEKPDLEQEVRLISDAGDNENVLAVNLSKMDQLASRLTPYLDSSFLTIS